MKKNKWILAIMTLMITSLVSGCGSTSTQGDSDSVVNDSSLPSLLEMTNDSSESDSSQAEATTSDSGNEDSSKIDSDKKELIGQWVQKNPNATYMVADIRKDGKIGVFFMLEDDDQPWTYWVGTYDAPDTISDKYSWESKNTYTGNGLLSSSAETKQFTYENDTLTFEVTIQGETHDVHLIRGEWDASAVPENAYAENGNNTISNPTDSEQDTGSKNDSKDILEITDSGWYLSGGEYLMYYVKIHNKSEDTICELPSFRIIARDSDGVLLASDDHTVSVIYPGQDFVCGTQAFKVDEVPAKVDFELMPPKDYNLKKMTGEYKPFEVKNTALREDRIVGEVYNSNSKAYDTVYVVAISKDASGNLCSIEIDFPDNLPANGSVPFDIGVYDSDEIASYEVYAYEW